MQLFKSATAAAKRFAAFIRVAAVGVLVLHVFAKAGSAETLAGVSFPDSEVVDGTALVLNGLGLREATIFNVDVYVAALYLQERSSDPAAIISAQSPKLLRLKFVRDVDKEKLTEAWIEGFEKNSSSFSKIKDRVAMLNSHMRDVSSGETMTFTFHPDQVELSIGTNPQGVVISGRDFLEALLSVWLGPFPPNESLKQGLLNR